VRFSARNNPHCSDCPGEGLAGYEVLDKSKVRGSATKLMTDLVSLVRYAVHQENELRPFKDIVLARFELWLSQQEKQGRNSRMSRGNGLPAIRDHIAASVSIEPDDFELPPFSQMGRPRKKRIRFLALICSQFLTNSTRYSLREINLQHDKLPPGWAEAPSARTGYDHHEGQHNDYVWSRL